MRRNGGPVGRRRGPTDAGTVADLLDVLEARERNQSAHELPSSAHRSLTTSCVLFSNLVLAFALLYLYSCWTGACCASLFR